MIKTNVKIEKEANLMAKMTDPPVTQLLENLM